MILHPSFLMVPDDSLENTRRRILDREPYALHGVSSCFNPDCSSCNQWKQWARDLASVNREIQERNNKKA